MGKKKSNSANAARLLESKVAPILEINYPDPLFTIAAHPTRPILAQGLGTGHVFCSLYDAEKLEELQESERQKLVKIQSEAYKKGKVSEIIKSVSQLKHKWWSVVDDISEPSADSFVKTMWKTKRHKGSCRSILFDPLPNSVGENIFTAGTDHIIKKADTETGKVIGKVDVSKDFSTTDSMTKLCHSTTNPFILAGTENGHVLVYDSANLSKSKIKFKVPNAHEDCINHILPMPAVSAYHYLTLGSTTLSHIDIRKGIVTQSDDQEDELLSMCFASDHINDNKNDTVLVSHGEGIVTIWKNSKNHWRDQLSRIKVNKGVSLDTIVPSMNCDTDEMANSVWCGDSYGLLHRINYKSGKVIETRVHSNASGKYGAVDEVGNLDIDYNYRLISSGMDSLKIWSERTQDELQEDEDMNDDSDESGDSSDSDSDDVSDSGSESESISDSNSVSNALDLSDSDNHQDDQKDSESDSDSHEEDTGPSIVRKKRIISEAKPKKRIINFESSEPEEEATNKKKKPKSKELTNKQLRNMQKHEHGIRKFDDL